MIESKDRPKLWAEKEEWGFIQGTKETEIVSVRLLNGRDKDSEAFFSRQPLKVRVDYSVNEVTIEPHFGVAIFREDGVYCYGPNTLLDGIFIERLKPGTGFFQIEFNELPLAAGNYRISAAIWDRKEVIAYSYHPAHYKFKIGDMNEEDVLLELEHKWLDNAQAPAASVMVSDSRGNDRREFITGEDLYVRAGLNYGAGQGSRRHIQIRLYRRDGVYCFGADKILNDGEDAVTLCLPRLNLLRGRYGVSVWSGCGEPGVLEAPRPALHPFEMKSPRRDHGTIYIEHSWEGTAIG